jgi:hypothetical protein
MNLPNRRLLAYNLLVLIKIIALTILALVGLLLMISEPIGDDESLTILLVSKVLGILALYTSYVIYNSSLNKLNE